MGCRAGCSEAELRLLLVETLAANGLCLADLSGLASVEHKREEAGLRALATQLNLPLSWWAPEPLQAFSDRIGQTSELALRTTGTASVAEACALAQVEALSGRRASLRIGKHSSAQATVAVAGVEEQA
jgi:cobalt-precorrin 5A hydrolase